MSPIIGDTAGRDITCVWRFRRIFSVHTLCLLLGAAELAGGLQMGNLAALKEALQLVTHAGDPV